MVYELYLNFKIFNIKKKEKEKKVGIEPSSKIKICQY